MAGSSTLLTHRDIDQRSLALHRAVADKLRREPQHMAVVGATLDRWRGMASAHVQPYLDAWQHLLAAGVEAALAMATADTEHAAALRQSSPFCGVLTHRERHEFMREWSGLPLSEARRAALQAWVNGKAELR